MAILIHSAVLATAIGATAAVAFGGANVLGERQAAAAKGDRLAIESHCEVAAADPMVCNPASAVRYVTIEERSDGVSVLTRVPITAGQ